jgi:branched-chain amino acid transport system permease protein
MSTGARRMEMGVLALIALWVILVPFTGSRFWMYNLTIVSLYATVVVSLNLLLGYAGQVSFAQTTFMAIGGYGSAILTKRWAVDPWLAILAAASFAVVFALLIGLPLLRLRGHYLALATFALALGTTRFASGATGLTNGSIGISAVPPLVLGRHVFGPTGYYVLGWLVCAIATLAVVALADSHVGRAWRALAVRGDVAATLGIDVNRYKLLALAIAALIASVAGSLYVEFATFVGPDLYDIGTIINLFIMLFIGGLGSIAGPVAGSLVVIVIPQLIAGLERYQNLVFFTLLLALILVRPAGLFGRRREPVPLTAVLPAWIRRHRIEAR